LIFREAIELDHRDHLADLHRRAAHPAKLVDEFIHERRSALLLGRRRPRRCTHPISDPHSSPPHALARHKPADAHGPRDATGRQLLRLRRGILSR
jgi:hypothetical protein